MNKHLIDGQPLGTREALRETLEQHTVVAVLNGAKWLTAQGVASLWKSEPADALYSAGDWLREGLLFAIDHEGRRLFPGYAFNDSGEPIPALKEVLSVFEGYSPFRLAAWFESASSQLGGVRPRELIAHDPAAVIAAAKAQKLGPLHG
ncbi:hypothetical protein [Paucibacter sp. DJ1R-11]|uniref:hypothetical protein n=1 Tax=Paucibacter sp. DJ1R-11 TaxID=2893556 RepID=UPI0021E3B41B|nr:hypothetical protein [Paucibacter sp. DJ1R-11]